MNSFRRSPLVLWLLASGCQDYVDEQTVEFTLDPEHPAVLIHASLNRSATPQILYVGEDGWLTTDAETPCRVAIYHYGDNPVPSEWPSPGDPPEGAAVIHRDFVLDADAPADWISNDIVEFDAGPTSGSLLISSCGAAELRGRLQIVGWIDEGGRLDVELRRAANE